MKRIAFFAGLLLTAALLPMAGATPVSSCGGYQQCVQAEIANIAGVINGGNIQSYTGYRPVQLIGDVGGVSNFLSMPGVSGTPAVTYTLSNLVGCTSGTVTTQASGASTFNTFSYDVPLTTTDTTCTGTLRVQVTAGVVPTEVWDQLIRFTFPAEGDLDTQARLCDASAVNTACNNPELNNQNRACVASTFTAPCATTTFEQVTGLTAQELFLLVICCLAALFFGAIARQPIARFGSGVLLIMLGTLLLSVTRTPIVILTGGFFLVVGALIFMQAALEWTRTRKKPKVMFE